MSLEESLREELDAPWSRKVLDMDRRFVVFKDESIGEVSAWHWDFG